MAGALRGMFAAHGYEEVGYEVHDTDVWAVGSHRLTVPPVPWRPGTPIFEFDGDGHEPA